MYADFLHIILVHIPVFGGLISAFLGWRALKHKDAKTCKIFYGSAIVLGILASIAYFSGVETAIWLKAHDKAYNLTRVENHALWGRVGFIVSVLGGLMGVVGISAYAQEEKPHKITPYLLFITALCLALLMLYVAHLGGLIRRPELI